MALRAAPGRARPRAQEPRAVARVAVRRCGRRQTTLRARATRRVALMPQSVSIAIPAFNEAPRLPRFLRALAEALARERGAIVELLVVDDGSRPEDLAAHSCLIQSRTSQTVSLESLARKTTVTLSARLIAGPSDNLLGPVLAGLGISALPEIQAASLLRKGELLRVLPEWDMPAFEVQVLYPAQKKLPAATRSLIECFVSRVPPAIRKLLDQR